MRRALLLLALAGCASERIRERPLDEAVRDGVSFLLASQNADGSWGSAGGTTGFDVYAPVPGSHHAFRVATTALCVMALRECGEVRGAEARRRGLEYLLGHTDVRRQDAQALYNVWAHAYALQALVGEVRATGDVRARQAAERHVRWLERYETMYGGWNYYDFTVGTQRPASSGTSFGTGAGVVALTEARDVGIEIPERMMERALKVLRQCRKPDGSYLYDLEFRYWPAHLANRDKGSLGRAQAPNLALWMNGGLITERDVRARLDAMFREHRYLAMGRKRQYPHEAWYYNSGYYYYFGHYYAARLIAELPATERAPYAAQLRAAILPFQESDGSWWDYAMYGYHKPYGTALALLAIIGVR
jgi:hypothetical protein